MRMKARPAATLALALTAGAALLACSRPPAANQPRPASRPAPPVTQPMQAKTLAISGYNYTDTGIGSFSVGFAGGGNIAVSSPTSGGGGTTCCVRALLYAADVKYRVKWTRDGDTWCEQDVPITGPIPKDPANLEVHFYRDGHIEIGVTDVYSEPRLKLEQAHDNSRHKDERLNVNNDALYSRCKLGY